MRLLNKLDCDSTAFRYIKLSKVLYFLAYFAFPYNSPHNLLSWRSKCCLRG